MSADLSIAGLAPDEKNVLMQLKSLALVRGAKYTLDFNDDIQGIVNPKILVTRLRVILFKLNDRELVKSSSIKGESGLFLIEMKSPSAKIYQISPNSNS